MMLSTSPALLHSEDSPYTVKVNKHLSSHSNVAVSCSTTIQVNKLVLAHLAADRVPIASSGVRYQDTNIQLKTFKIQVCWIPPRPNIHTNIHTNIRTNIHTNIRTNIRTNIKF